MEIRLIGVENSGGVVVCVSPRGDVEVKIEKDTSGFVFASMPESPPVSPAENGGPTPPRAR